MSSQPPASKPKSWADVVKTNVQSREQPASSPQTSTSQAPQPVRRDTLPPVPRVVPKPAAPLPPASSTSAVQPCDFDSIQKRGYPLGFESYEQFAECMQDLCNTAAEAGINCIGAGVRGSAATYTSSNPHKQGQHFDSRGKGRSDIDAFLVSDDRLTCWPNRDGFFHPDKVATDYPALKEWGDKWSKKLDREITPAVFKSKASVFEEPYIPF